MRIRLSRYGLRAEDENTRYFKQLCWVDDILRWLSAELCRPDSCGASADVGALYSQADPERVRLALHSFLDLLYHFECEEEALYRDLASIQAHAQLFHNLVAMALDRSAPYHLKPLDGQTRLFDDRAAELLLCLGESIAEAYDLNILLRTEKETGAYFIVRPIL